MKKILAIIGSPRKGETLKIVKQFQEKLQAMGETEFTYVFLKDHNIKLCRGCFLCLERGEEFCPNYDDDTDKIAKMMHGADGIIFATPNYSLQVTAIMKNFLDRMAYVFHRPRFFHKVFIPIVTQGVHGGEQIVKYLENVSDFWGLIVAKGVLVNTPPGVRLPKEAAAIEKKVAEGAQRFYQALNGNLSPSPKLKKIFLFRLVCALKPFGPEDCDYRYFRDKGWLEAPYFYKTKISLIGRIIGKATELFFSKEGEKRQQAISQSGGASPQAKLKRS